MRGGDARQRLSVGTKRSAELISPELSHLHANTPGQDIANCDNSPVLVGGLVIRFGRRVAGLAELPGLIYSLLEPLSTEPPVKEI